MTGNFQLDLATVILRLRQIKREVERGTSGTYGDIDLIFDRVLTCDLPRLEQYLSAEGREHVSRAEE